MTWQTGHDLAQTVFTCLYCLNMDAFDLPKLHARYGSQPTPTDRPLKLVGLVLRAYVAATLKTCDIICLELHRGNVMEVSLLLTYPRSL